MAAFPVKDKSRMTGTRDTVIIACAALRRELEKRAEDLGARVIVMDYGLHLTPRNMRAAIQEQLDLLPGPHLVLIGFGLCGNGLAGLQSRAHTLIVPRVDDCVALMFGSRPAYMQEFASEPGTYYLTPGWLECGGEPRTEFLKCRDKYGEQKAATIANALYGNYRKSCLLALTPGDMDHYRPQAQQVADFCKERWGWQYREVVGSNAYILRLLDFIRAGVPADPGQDPEDFVILRPGEEVKQEAFMLPASTQAQ
jgi:hypothetical protein